MISLFDGTPIAYKIFGMRRKPMTDARAREILRGIEYDWLVEVMKERKVVKANEKV